MGLFFFGVLKQVNPMERGHQSFKIILKIYPFNIFSDTFTKISFEYSSVELVLVIAWFAVQLTINVTSGS